MTEDPADPDFQAELAEREAERELAGVATFGAQVSEDTSSPIIVLLLKRSREQAEMATQALVNADPFKPEKIMELQSVIRRAAEMRDWITQAIEEGEAAEIVLRSRTTET